jgi:MYXO-CTERM domain-containing protein
MAAWCNGWTRRAVTLACGASLWAISLTARATSDAGTIPELVAFAGPEERYAIVAFENVQIPCQHGACTIVAIDLRAKDYRERWAQPAVVQRDEVTLMAMAEDWAVKVEQEGKTLRPLRPAGEGEPLATFPPEGTVVVGGDMLQLVERRRLASMRAYDLLSQQPCYIDECSSCERLTWELNGRSRERRLCKDEPGTFPQLGKPCNCHATGRIVALEGKGWVGREIWLAPWAMSQNNMSGPGTDDTDTTVRLPAAEVRIHENAHGDRVLTGGVVHAPRHNGTWFPLVAYRRAEAEPSSGEEEPVVAMTSHAGEGVTVVGPQPKRGGCASCHLGGGGPGSWGWLGVVALGWWRRRDRPAA